MPHPPPLSLTHSLAAMQSPLTLHLALSENTPAGSQERPHAPAPDIPLSFDQEPQQFPAFSIGSCLLPQDCARSCTETLEIASSHDTLRRTHGGELLSLAENASTGATYRAHLKGEDCTPPALSHLTIGTPVWLGPSTPFYLPLSPLLAADVRPEADPSRDRGDHFPYRLPRAAALREGSAWAEIITAPWKREIIPLAHRGDRVAPPTDHPALAALAFPKGHLGYFPLLAMRLAAFTLTTHPETQRRIWNATFEEIHPQTRLIPVLNPVDQAA